MSVPPLEPDGLVAAGIHTVIIATPDLQGRLAGRRIPVERFADAVEAGVDICLSVWSWDIAQSTELIDADRLELCGAHNGVPDATMLPDLSTLRRAAWLDGVAICLADVVDASTREPLPIAPRGILRAELERLEAAGFAASVGTELEFYLFRNEPRRLRQSGFRDLEPTTLVPADFMIHEGDVYEQFFRSLRERLEASDVPIEAAQSELGRGQWELTFPHDEPLRIADRHALYKLAVRDMAAAAGYSVTFMAKPLGDQPGSSCHIHASLRTADGTAAFFAPGAQDGMSDTMRHAVAGVMRHAGDLASWYAPTVNSYRRFAADQVVGGSGFWGIDDRTAAVRVVGSSASSKRFEMRVGGADANPYLALTALLASARDGIENGLALPPARTAAFTLPAHLGEAATRLASSALAQSILPAVALDHLTTLSSFEWEVFLRSVSDWDRDRYFDRI